jgi:hypothetical protein
LQKASPYWERAGEAQPGQRDLECGPALKVFKFPLEIKRKI